jgi:cyclopropane-fatty-acyl-phospholipid synthase
MASAEQIASTYDYMDELWRVSLGEHADITCAFFDGDYSLSLGEAQRRKYEYILSGVGFERGMRVLDIGCGWGGLLQEIERRGGRATGVTLSPAQREHCRGAGLDVHGIDWKVLGRSLGTFDAVVSVGAFEHFCSKEEFLAGRQGQVYDDFFALCADLLPPHGRMFLQTMTWGSRGVPDPARIRVDAGKGSDERMLGALERFYPGSWLPSGLDQISGAAGDFEVVAVSNGRLDYIETMSRWAEAVATLRPAKILPALRLVRYLFTDRDFFHKIETLTRSYNRECFRREIMDHYRMVLQKR